MKREKGGGLGKENRKKNSMWNEEQKMTKISDKGGRKERDEEGEKKKRKAPDRYCSLGKGGTKRRRQTDRFMKGIAGVYVKD